MICWHRNYRLGDPHSYADHNEFLRDLVRQSVPWEAIKQAIITGGTTVELKIDKAPEGETPFSLMSPYRLPCKGRYKICAAQTIDELFAEHNRDEILEELSDSDLCKFIQESNEIALLPLWLYDHSGISLSTSHEYPYNDRWDSGQVGWIYITKARFQKEMGDGSIWSE